MRHLILIYLLLAFGLVQGQTPVSFEKEARKIRIKKIAREWMGTDLTLHYYDGRTLRGELTNVSSEMFFIDQRGVESQVPFEAIEAVSFDPGLPELILTVSSSVMGAAFLVGSLLLIDNDVSDNSKAISAGLGLIGGGLWGYSNFFESEIIYLE